MDAPIKNGLSMDELKFIAESEQIWQLFFEGKLVPLEMTRGRGLANERDVLLRKSTITDNYRKRNQPELTREKEHPGNEKEVKSVFPKDKQFKISLQLRLSNCAIYFLIH